ncbi:MAG: hypothetical protein EDX89_00565 [Acidobacteria bacterium]|nr:MAG: hypothetical protein EDX89_00565 [Acidobacteriota bacterium]MCE7959969.1 hypothetical protein [Acidobacteria bacterium ACB2]
MKRLVPLAVVALLALAGWRWWAGRAPDRVYRAFAEEWAKGRTDLALAFAEGAAVEKALAEKALTKVVGVGMDARHGIVTGVESKAKTPDGDVVLHGRQSVWFDPPGVSSALGGAMVATFTHDVTLRETPAGWKVVAFDAKRVSVGDARP